MSEFFDNLLAWHDTHSHLVRATLAGVLVASVCGVVGCYIILRRMAFLGDAIAHAMLAGVVVGYLLMKWQFGLEANAPGMLIGSLVAGFLTVLLVGFVSKLSRIKEDTAIGIMYTGVFAAGGLLASLFSQYIHLDLLHFVTGNVLAVELIDLWMIAGVAAFVLAVVLLLFRPLQIVSFDPVMAASLGIPVVLLDYLLTACTSLVVVSAVNIVGVILVVGFLVTPAATAYLFCDRLSRMLVVSAAAAISSFLIGFVGSAVINVAPGSAIVVVSTGQFLVALAFAPRYGLLADWRRRRAAVPQRVVEDVLGCVLRDPAAGTLEATLLEHVHSSGEQVRKAVRWLQREGLLAVDRAGLMTLTESGQHEARRLLRAHRLWETYLERLGTPASDLHDRAHDLEHIHDELAVDYLDDQLGHPLVDPHGADIPEDFVHLTPGAQVRSSLLRAGHSGQITALDPPVADLPLAVGMTVIAGARRDGGRLWTLRTPAGEWIELDHRQADAVHLRLDEPPPVSTSSPGAR